MSKVESFLLVRLARSICDRKFECCKLDRHQSCGLHYHSVGNIKISKFVQLVLPMDRAKRKEVATSESSRVYRQFPRLQNH